MSFLVVFYNLTETSYVEAVKTLRVNYLSINYNSNINNLIQYVQLCDKINLVQPRKSLGWR